MRFGIAGKSRSHENIAPIALGEVYCFSKLCQIALTQFQGCKTNRVQCGRRAVPMKRKVASALVCKQSRCRISFVWTKKQVDAEFDFV